MGCRSGLSTGLCPSGPPRNNSAGFLPGGPPSRLSVLSAAQKILIVKHLPRDMILDLVKVKSYETFEILLLTTVSPVSCRENSN